jgi:multicomponent Na+:H+ antiporter subunit D
MTAAELVAAIRWHAPVIAALAPLLVAVFAGRGGRFAGAIGVSIFAIAILIMFDGAARSINAGGHTLSFGGEGPAGAELVMDGLSATGALAILIVAALCWAPALVWARAELAPSRRSGVLSLALIALAALIGAVFCKQLISAWILIQVASIGAVAVCASAVALDRRALSGAMGSLITLGACAGLFAIGAVMAQSAAKLNGASAGAGFALMGFSALAWAGAAPGLIWTVAGFGRGAFVGALLLGPAFAIVGISLTARVLAQAQALSHIAPLLYLAVGAAGALGVVVSALRAAGAQCLRRLTFYALGVQAGIAAIGWALGENGAGAGLLHLGHGVAVALCMTGGCGVIMGGRGAGAVAIERLDGLSSRAPMASAALALALLALVAPPFTAPFFTKWLIMEAAMDRGWPWATLALVFASLAGVLVAGRVIERIYFHEPIAQATPAPGRMGWAHAPAMAVGMVWLLVWGIGTTRALAVTQAIAGEFFGALTP